MSVEAHIQQLELRHQSLENQLAELSGMPSSSDKELSDVKRQKLKLKDEIVRLRTTN